MNLEDDVKRFPKALNLSKYRHETEENQVIKNHQLEAYVSDCVDDEEEESEKTEQSVRLKMIESTEEKVIL